MSGVPRWKRFRDSGRIEPADLLSAFGIAGPPIDVLAIAQGLDVEVAAASEPGWSGALRSDEEKATIWVRREDDPMRKRFTIAHELGHLMLHPLGQEWRDNPAFKGGAKEREANQFASKLLVPIGMLHTAIQRAGRAQEEALAQEFMVSLRMMRRRLDEWDNL
ncbi:MAG: ImmA/IrrE family metallo-endopeptidase [Deltaproteobacteria bacterium]|nr:ImmA/IrrE family metallo-endopeptidase [Deltaproteobacteria bacterium]